MSNITLHMSGDLGGNVSSVSYIVRRSIWVGHFCVGEWTGWSKFEYTSLLHESILLHDIAESVPIHAVIHKCFESIFSDHYHIIIIIGVGKRPEWFKLHLGSGSP